MIVLYQIVFFLLLLASAPLLPLLLLFPRVRKGFGMRLGILPKLVRHRAWLREGSLWVHAASLGEVNAVAPVVRELLPKLPRLSLVFTCTTSAGREQAERLFPQAEACLLLPLDLPFLVEPWVRRFKPQLAVIAETEYWPSFLLALRRSGCRVLVANGRLTERSFRRYRLAGRAFAELLEQVDLFAMQGEEDASRLIGLGARRARVLISGNTKFDLGADLEVIREAGRALRKSLGWEAESDVVVAGSTRPGEEALLLDAFRELRRNRSRLRLVLAPRHLERVPDVRALLKKGRWRFAVRSEGIGADDVEVLLLDTLGELRAAYTLAAGRGLAWVGGSFRDFGGQNPLEPAALGVPVLFGPFMRHFPELSAALLEAGAALQVPIEALARESLALLEDPRRREAMATAGPVCVAAHAGAAKRTADLGLRLLLLSRLRRETQSWREEGLKTFRASTEFGTALQEADWRREEPMATSEIREFGRRLERGEDAVD